MNDRIKQLEREIELLEKVLKLEKDIIELKRQNQVQPWPFSPVPIQPIQPIGPYYYITTLGNTI
jgi:hypothetical protein